MTNSIRPDMTTLHRNEEGQRWCSGLAGIEGHYATENDFTPHPRNLDGLQGACRSCHTAYDRLLNYGVTPKNYERAKAIQGGCYICRDTDAQLYVDHDHQTGEARGLLCNKCNIALGWLDDSVEKAAWLFHSIFIERRQTPTCSCPEVELCSRCRQGSSRLARDPYKLSRAVSYLDGDNAFAAIFLNARRNNA